MTWVFLLLMKVLVVVAPSDGCAVTPKLVVVKSMNSRGNAPNSPTSWHTPTWLIHEFVHHLYMTRTLLIHESCTSSTEFYQSAYELHWALHDFMWIGVRLRPISVWLRLISVWLRLISVRLIRLVHDCADNRMIIIRVTLIIVRLVNDYHDFKTVPHSWWGLVEVLLRSC